MKNEEYKIIKDELKAMIEGIKYDITILANASALMYENMSNVNWVGFYIFNNNQLLLGPFQGKPACMVIPVGKGVCGKCAAIKKPVIVQDVHEFKGHIACDSASNSEICIPLFKANKLYGLLDIDSPICARFDDNDLEKLLNISYIIEKAINNC